MQVYERSGIVLELLLGVIATAKFQLKVGTDLDSSGTVPDSLRTAVTVLLPSHDRFTNVPGALPQKLLNK
jgi:hypothetical protein